MVMLTICLGTHMVPEGLKDLFSVEIFQFVVSDTLEGNILDSAKTVLVVRGEIEC